MCTYVRRHLHTAGVGTVGIRVRAPAAWHERERSERPRLEIISPLSSKGGPRGGGGGGRSTDPLIYAIPCTRRRTISRSRHELDRLPMRREATLRVLESNG